MMESGTETKPILAIRFKLFKTKLKIMTKHDQKSQ
uniref:Uncharacterized protein n=1 Tax=Anguilla anguilla TaxID=7936 RepID=A0A0E9WGB3_ANGAN